MNDEKQIMNIFAQAYQLIAKASKQQPSQEGFQQVLEMLGEDGIKQCAEVADQGPEAVAQAMVQILQQKSTQKAAKGTKLRYLMQLKGKCEPGYLKSGGKCKPCEMGKGIFQNKADLMQNGGNTPSAAPVTTKYSQSTYYDPKDPNYRILRQEVYTPSPEKDEASYMRRVIRVSPEGNDTTIRSFSSRGSYATYPSRSNFENWSNRRTRTYTETKPKQGIKDYIQSKRKNK